MALNKITLFMIKNLFYDTILYNTTREFPNSRHFLCRLSYCVWYNQPMSDAHCDHTTPETPHLYKISFRQAIVNSLLQLIAAGLKYLFLKIRNTEISHLIEINNYMWNRISPFHTMWNIPALLLKNTLSLLIREIRTQDHH